MDGPFWNDMRVPFISGDIASVTLATTNKALYGQSNFPVLGGNYFGFPGKHLNIRMFGRMTTGITPGNGQCAVYFGTGADANGTILASSAVLALTASGTSLSWRASFDIHCRSIGSAGTLFCTGEFEFNVGLLASTLAPMLVPGSLPVVSAGVDLTAANMISVQFNRSGSTAEAMQIHELIVTALN